MSADHDEARNGFCALFLLVATVLVVLGKISGAEWIALVHWIGMMIVASKTAPAASSPSST